MNMMMPTITMTKTKRMMMMILVHLILAQISRHFLGFHFVTEFEPRGESEFRHVVVVVNVVVISMNVVVEPCFG